MHILIVEDDKELCAAIKLQLEARNHTTDCCHKGSDALYFAMNHSYDLILLDRMLPEIDGLTILRSIRNSHISVPVIITTALDTINDRIDGLDCGADDYLVKPYAIEELLARVRALSRRPNVFFGGQDLSFLDLSFSPDTRILSCNGQDIQMTGKTALLMEYFLRNPEKPLAREQIFTRVWGADAAVEDGNLDTYIYFLRKHLKTLKSQSVISTIHGLGYRLEAANVS